MAAPKKPATKVPVKSAAKKATTPTPPGRRGGPRKVPVVTAVAGPDVKVRARASVASATRSKKVTAGDPMATAMADPVVGPMLERSSKMDQYWGRRALVAPAEALLADVQRTHALIEWIEDRLRFFGGLDSMLCPPPLDQFDHDFKAKLKVIGGQEEQDYREAGRKVRHLKHMHDAACEHLSRVARAAEASRLAERQLVLNEGRARIMGAVIGAVFSSEKLALTKEQRAMLPELLRAAVVQHAPAAVESPFGERMMPAGMIEVR